MTDWVYCPAGRGYLHGGLAHERAAVSSRLRHFSLNAVGTRKAMDGQYVIVWLIGSGETWSVPGHEVRPVNVLETGDKWQNKICNICHCLLPVKDFA